MTEHAMREYVCPVCGYDGFRMSIRATIDVSVQPACPQCATLLLGVTVPLVETTDPRTAQ